MRNPLEKKAEKDRTIKASVGVTPQRRRRGVNGFKKRKVIPFVAGTNVVRKETKRENEGGGDKP